MANPSTATDHLRYDSQAPGSFSATTQAQQFTLGQDTLRCAGNCRLVCKGCFALQFRSVDAIHGTHGTLDGEAPVATVFIPDLAERLSSRGAGLLRSSSLSLLSLQPLRDDDDERLETFIYLAQTLNMATMTPTTPATNETYAEGVFCTVGRLAQNYAVSKKYPDLGVLVDSIIRALFELKNKDATRLGDPNARGEADSDGLIRAITTCLSQLASTGTFVSDLQGLPGSVLSGPKVLITKLLRSALRLPECHFLVAADWEYALPIYTLKLEGMQQLRMYNLKLEGIQQPSSPLACTKSPMLPLSRSLRSRSTPNTNSPTVTHPPYILAVGRLVPISGSMAKVGHTLPHLVIGGSVSDDIGADLLSLINTDSRYHALADDLRLAGFGAAPSSSSGASASGIATPTSREPTPQYFSDTPPELGIPVLPLGVDPISAGAKGVVHQVIGFRDTPLVAQVYHTDRLEAAANELSIYHKIYSALQSAKLVTQLFGAYRGSQYLDWETIIVVMQDGGSALHSWTDLTPDERVTLYANLQDLHSLGIYHSHVQPRNVLRSSVGQLRFIDFAAAFTHDCDGNDCCELQRFREILEL